MENHWKTDTIPHYGWGCSDIQDLGDVDFICEMCGYKRIRYVHYMTQEVDGKLLLIKSGCICAGRMEGSEEASKDRERVFKNKLNRRKNWLTRIWKRSRRGNHHLTVRNCHLLVFESKFNDGLWGFQVDNYFGTTEYPTRDAAKLALFDAFEKYESIYHTLSSEYGNTEVRKEIWMLFGWRRSKAGGLYRQDDIGWKFSIFKNKRQPQFWSTNFNGTFGTKVYATIEDAKSGLYQYAYARIGGAAL